MNQQIRGANALSPGDLPMKRKRGRPRKDESLVQGESTQMVPGSDSLKKSKQSVGSTDTVDKMVGQVVSGVIECTFDAGYLLNVKVADTDTQLRGVVFLPGQFSPITAANDVAPHVRMYKRKEIPIPTFKQQSQRCHSVHPEKSDKQPAETKNQAPTFTEHCKPSQSQPVLSVAPKHQSSTVVIPLADSIPNNDTGLSLRVKVTPQINEPGLDSQPAPVMAQMECNKVVEGSEVLQKTEDSTLMKGPNEVETNEKSKAEPESEPLVDTLLRIGASKLMEGPNEVQVTENSKSEPATELVVDLLPDIEASKLMKGPNEAETNEISKVEPVPAPVSEMLAGVETSTLVKGPNDVEANKESKEETAPPPVIDIFQGIEVFGEDLNTDSTKDLVHDDMKTPNLELNHPPAPVVAEPELPNSEQHCKSVNDLMEKQDNGEGLLQETQSGHAIEISNGEATPEGDATNTTGVVSLSAVNHSGPAMMFEEEAIPSESKLSSEEHVPPGPNKPQICSPSDVISSMKCEIKDAIPPQQS